MKKHHNTSSNQEFCGAKIIYRNAVCTRKALKNGRCHLHGGLSTGPKTQAGIEAIRKAKIRHGRRSKEYLHSQSLINSFLKKL